MIETFLYQILESGLDEVKADPTLLEDLFSRLHSLPDAEVAGIKQLFATWLAEEPIRKPAVIHGYPRTSSPFPLYAIVLGEEHEDEDVLGYDGGIVEDPDDPNFGADCLVSFWNHNYHIQCYSEHPDATRYMYELAKYIILEGYKALHPEDVSDMTMRGNDLAPDPRYIPEHLFGRVLTFSANRKFSRIDAESRIGRAFQVRGIHIDKSGSPRDTGGVKTLLYPVTVEE